MRPNRLRLRTIAAWFGVIALSIDALVPVHLAFDLANAFETATYRGEARPVAHDLSWRLLALLTGHLDGDGSSGGKADGHGKHHHPECAVCSSLGALAGFAAAAAVPLSVPSRVEAPILPAAAATAPPAAPAAAYRSRAPPIASADPTT